MSDMRFTLIGVALVFVGFIVLGIFGSHFFDSTVESQEFDDCYEYYTDKPPVEVSCDEALQNKTAFFALVIGLIGAGVFCLIKGVRGDWDQKIRPEDMLGPGAKDNTSDEDDKSNK